ncbi:MAG: hypothetical protein ABI599_07090 [Flavobacteriales bacterium]
MQRISLVAAIAALAVVFYLMQRLGRTEQELAAMKAMVAMKSASPPEGGSEGAGKVELEVAVYMGRIQQYAHKLWAAGKASNLPLAKFYLHEMDEAMEDLQHANIEDDGVPVSKHMETYGIRAIDGLADNLKANGLKDFDGQFALLVNTCNSCHDKCGYPFIRIAVPAAPPVGVQDFRP